MSEHLQGRYYLVPLRGKIGGGREHAIEPDLPAGVIVPDDLSARDAYAAAVDLEAGEQLRRLEDLPQFSPEALVLQTEIQQVLAQSILVRHARAKYEAAMAPLLGNAYSVLASEEPKRALILLTARDHTLVEQDDRTVLLAADPLDSYATDQDVQQHARDALAERLRDEHGIDVGEPASDAEMIAAVTETLGRI